MRLTEAESFLAGAPAKPGLEAPIVRCTDALLAVLPAGRALGPEAEHAFVGVVQAQATAPAGFLPPGEGPAAEACRGPASTWPAATARSPRTASIDSRTPA